MLSIIPKEVLANLTNIHKLLDINQNLSKNNKKPKKAAIENIQIASAALNTNESDNPHSKAITASNL